MSRHGKHWTRDEMRLLRETYPAEGAKRCTRYLDRTADAIRVKASESGIARGFELDRWTPERIEALRLAYAGPASLVATARAFGMSNTKLVRIATRCGWTRLPAKRGRRPRLQVDPVQDAMDAIRRRIESEIAAHAESTSAQGLAPRVTEEKPTHAIAAE